MNILKEASFGTVRKHSPQKGYYDEPRRYARAAQIDGSFWFYYYNNFENRVQSRYRAVDGATYANGHSESAVKYAGFKCSSATEAERRVAEAKAKFG